MFENKHKLSQKLASQSPSDFDSETFNDAFQSRFNVYVIAKKKFIIILHLLLLIKNFLQRRLQHVTHVIVFSV